MEQINIPFPLYRLRNGEHYQLGRDVLKKVTPELAQKYGFYAVYVPYKGVFDTEDACYLQSRGFESTPEIETSDEERDELLVFLTQSIIAATHSPVKETKEAANRLYFILKPHIKAYELNYVEETGSVADLCGKLKAEENTADVEKVGMTDAVRLLEEANESFNALYSSRSIDLLNRTTSETMKTIRPKVDEAFKALVSAINAVYQVNELVTKSPETKKELGGVIKQINGHLVQLQQILIRAGVIKSDVADEETVIPTPEEPVTPEITKFYPKENANPDRPLDFPRNKTAVLEGKGLKLVDSPEGKKAQLVLINYVEQRMPHEDSAILLNTDEKIEFTMMYDAAEGQYNFQIETYPNGTEEVVIIKYPETITLV